MNQTITKRRIILAPELRRLLGFSHSQQFDRILPELVEFGAFRIGNGRWRMYEDDLNRFIAAKQSECAKKIAERRAL